MQVELNTICCEAMCTALSQDDLVLRPDGPALPDEEAPAICFCPFCGVQYLPPDDGATWGWRLARPVSDDSPVATRGQIEYNTPY